MLFELWFSSNTCIQLKQCTIVMKMGKEYNLVDRQIDWQELRSKTRWSIGKHPLIIISKSPRSEGFPFLQSFKAVSVTLNRLLLLVQICDATGCFVKGTKYHVRQIVHKTTRTDFNSRTL